MTLFIKGRELKVGDDVKLRHGGIYTITEIIVKSNPRVLIEFDESVTIYYNNHKHDTNAIYRKEYGMGTDDLDIVEIMSPKVIVKYRNIYKDGILGLKHETFKEAVESRSGDLSTGQVLKLTTQIEEPYTSTAEIIEIKG